MNLMEINMAELSNIYIYILQMATIQDKSLVPRQILT